MRTLTTRFGPNPSRVNASPRQQQYHVLFIPFLTKLSPQRFKGIANQTSKGSLNPSTSKPQTTTKSQKPLEKKGSTTILGESQATNTQRSRPLKPASKESEPVKPLALSTPVQAIVPLPELETPVTQIPFAADSPFTALETPTVSYNLFWLVNPRHKSFKRIIMSKSYFKMRELR